MVEQAPYSRFGRPAGADRVVHDHCGPTGHIADEFLGRHAGDRYTGLAHHGDGAQQ